MKIDLKQLFEVVGDSLEIDYSIDLSQYELWGNFPFISPIKIQGSIQNKAGIVTLRVEVSFEMQLSCDRCLVEYKEKYLKKFEHILVSSTNTDNDEYIVVENSKLDLDELILSDILLKLPTKLLCKDDCKGLCDLCGKDLNEGNCECKKDVGDLRFKVLDELLT
jgi:uncharacterized protein